LKFVPLAVEGAYRVEPEPVSDERGMFARLYCSETFAREGLSAELSQASVSCNRLRGTLRGMHLQKTPYEEAKLVRCTRGSIHDVVVDMRPGSPTYLRWDAAILDARNLHACYVPPGCAHGYLTLSDDTEVHYLISAPYHEESAAGVRWNDPRLAIAWPGSPGVISSRDASWPLLS